MCKIFIFTNNVNMHYLTRPWEGRKGSTTWTCVFRIIVRVWTKGKRPKTRNQTRQTRTQGHHVPHSKSWQNAEQRDMHKRVWWGCPCMSMVCIHGCGWVCWDIIEAWCAGRRQSELRMTVISRLCTPEQAKDNKMQELARRDKGG